MRTTAQALYQATSTSAKTSSACLMEARGGKGTVESPRQIGCKQPPKKMRRKDASDVYPDELSEADRALGMAAAAEDREGRNPPAWVRDEAIWRKAKAAVEPRVAEYDEPWAVVTHVYRQMGGKISR